MRRAPCVAGVRGATGTLVGLSFQIDGLADLTARLARLSEVGAKRVLDRTARKSMQPVLLEAQRLVPVSQEGGPHLRDALTISVRKDATPGVASTVTLRVKKLPVRVRRFLRFLRSQGVALAHPSPRRIWHLVEFGTSRSRAKPYIRPAFDSRKGEVVEMVRTDLAKRIERAVRNSDPGAE